MSFSAHSSEADGIRTPPSPYKHLSTVQHLIISAYWFATNFLWSGLLVVLLPREIKAMNPAYRAETLGLLTGVAAIVALVVPLFVGALSDRCVHRWGRRRPFMAVGITLNLIGLAGMAAAFIASGQNPNGTATGLWPSLFSNGPLLMFFLMYLVVQFGNNVTSAAYMGVIPDVVPENQRGQASGYMALMSQLGSLVGILVCGVGLGPKADTLAYLITGVALLGIALVTLLGLRETPLQMEKQTVNWGEYIRSLWISPKQYPDFAWVWITRALVMLGFYAVLPFINYYLGDVIGIPEDQQGSKSAILFAIILFFSSISGIVGGSLSDRIGRKRVVYISNSGIALTAIGFIFCRDFSHVLVVGVLFGLAYGAYISVDYALGTDVLPSRKDAGKEMAVWHIAMTLPQSLAAPASGFLIAAFGVTTTPAKELGEKPIEHYTVAGYSAVFFGCAVCFALGAWLLKNVRGVK